MDLTTIPQGTFEWLILIASIVVSIVLTSTVWSVLARLRVFEKSKKSYGARWAIVALLVALIITVFLRVDIAYSVKLLGTLSMLLAATTLILIRYLRMPSASELTTEAAVSSLETMGLARSLIDTSLCGMYIYDIEQDGLVYINEVFTSITGYSLKDVDNTQGPHYFQSVIDAKSLASFQAELERLSDSPNAKPYNFEFRLKLKQGGWIDCMGQITRPVSDSTWLVGSFINLSEQRNNALRNETLLERFSSTFEQAAVGLAHVSLEGKFIRVNKKLADIVEYAPEVLVNLTFMEITHPDDLESDLALLGQLTRGDIETYQMEKRYFTSTGRLVWILLTVSMVRAPSSGDPYYISVIQDITAKKQIEEDLESLNSYLERFAFSASHDLQEPLRKISAFSESIMERLEAQDSLDDDSRFELSRLNDASHRMKQMIQSLLDLSRFNESAISLEELKLSELVEQCKDDLQVLMIQTSARVDVTSDLDIEVDRIAFLRVIANLVVNGINFARLDVPPLITIEGCVDAGLGQSVIYVSDNGRGIPESKFGDVFFPFKRLDRRSVPGAGMGLTIVQQILRAHSGSIKVKKSSSEGTTFEIRLPQFIKKDN